MGVGAEIAVYWKTAVVVCSALSGGVGYILGLLRSRWEFAQAKQAVETKAIGQIVMAITESRKVAAGTRDLTFYEADLREWVGDHHAPRLHAALEMLRDQGRAKKAPEPGRWIID
jgi:hypothetical protein